MRIRKRKVSFPISSLSPIPISDPLFPLRPPSPPPPMVQLPLQLEDDADDYYDPKPSDQPTPNGQDSSAVESAAAVVAVAATSKGENKEVKVLLEETGRGHDRGNRVGGTIIMNSNSSGKGSPSNVGVPMENMIIQQPSASSSLQEKVKRKETNKKNSKQQHNGYVKEENDQSSGGSIRSTDQELDVVAAAGKKARGRSGGAALMEGSRCSRVNGRGWRCCQQTLVGYSLCEHHLGKGRLRSMNNVRSIRAKANNDDDGAAQKKYKAVTQMPLWNNEQDVPKESSRNGDGHGRLAEKLPAKATMSKRKTKPGVVKARSMSSLLGQQNEAYGHDQVQG